MSKASENTRVNLETELTVLNRTINNHPNRDNFHYSKAMVLWKLAENTENK